MTQLGKYRLIRKLASGGMAEVHLAVSSGPGGFQKSFVIKRIHPHLAEDPRFVAMFHDEAKLAAQLVHPNLVQIFEFGKTEGGFFLAMELVDGPNLRTVIQSALELGRPLEPAVCARLISLACEGLSYAHDFKDPATGEPLHLVHRDVSPDNLLLDRNGTLKVTDFGVAKARGARQETLAGVVKGKLAYMAPEQLQGGEALSHRSDIYALGVVLYELLCGKLPYEGSADGELIHAILFGRVIPPSERRADVPAALEALLLRTLSRDPSLRPADCRTLSRELEQIIAAGGRLVDAGDLQQLVLALAPAAPLSAERASPTPIPLVAASIARTEPEASLAATAMRMSNPGMAAYFGEELSSPYEAPAGKALGADGRVEHTAAGFDAKEVAKGSEGRADPRTAEQPVWLAAPAEDLAAPAQGNAAFKPAEPPPLELARTVGPSRTSSEDVRALPDSFVTEYQLRRRRRLFLAGAVVLVAMGAGVLALPAITSSAAVVSDEWTEPALLVVDSEPSGAQVLISGNSVGETPLAIDNVWAPGDVAIEVRMKGFKSWRGTFKGREAQQIDAALRK